MFSTQEETHPHIPAETPRVGMFMPVIVRMGHGFALIIKKTFLQAVFQPHNQLNSVLQTALITSISNLKYLLSKIHLLNVASSSQNSALKFRMAAAATPATKPVKVLKAVPHLMDGLSMEPVVKIGQWVLLLVMASVHTQAVIALGLPKEPVAGVLRLGSSHLPWI